MTDPFAQPEGNYQGRRRIGLGMLPILREALSLSFSMRSISKELTDMVSDKTLGARFCIEDIDALLGALDKDHESSVTSEKGLFSIFQSVPPKTPAEDLSRSIEIEPKDSQVTPETDLSSPEPCANSDDLLGRVNENDILVDKTIDDDNLGSDPGLLAEEVQSCNGRSFVDVLHAADIAGEETTLFELCDPPWPLSSNQLHAALEPEDENSPLVTQLSFLNDSLLLDPRDQALTHTSPFFAIGSTLTGDSASDYLLQHYTVHVADILQPVLHSHSPYRFQYVPNAIEGAFMSRVNLKASANNVYLALYHAILSSAAFHRWNCDRVQLEYRKMAMKHRRHALHQLQCAIGHSASGSNYRMLLMAMLCLITTSVRPLPIISSMYLTITDVHVGNNGRRRLSGTPERSQAARQSTQRLESDQWPDTAAQRHPLVSFPSGPHLEF